MLPEKAVLRANGADAKDILDHYAAQGALPKPFAPFMGSTGQLSASTPEEKTPEEKSANRQSTASWVSIPRGSLFVASRRSSMSSIASSSAGGDKRKVRQMFNPVLPDELVISLGEALTGASGSIANSKSGTDALASCQLVRRRLVHRRPRQCLQVRRS